MYTADPVSPLIVSYLFLILIKFRLPHPGKSFTDSGLLGLFCDLVSVNKAPLCEHQIGTIDWNLVGLLLGTQLKALSPQSISNKLVKKKSSAS